MLENAKINIIVDSQDLSCPVCYSPFGIKENLPISLNCGHTFCSICISKMDKCALCKNRFRKRQKFYKSILIFSLLESISKVKKCTVHEKPIGGFCSETKKLVSFDCLSNKQQVISIRDIDRKVDQLSKMIQETQEYYQTEVKKFLQTEQENFKRQVDGVLHEETCYAPVLKGKLYKEIEAWMGLEKNYVAEENLMEKCQSIEIVLEKWRRNSKQETDVAMRILEAKLDLKTSSETLHKTIEGLKRKISEKENQLLAEINSHQTTIGYFSKKLKKAFEISPEMTLEKVPVELELQYLHEISEEYGVKVKTKDHVMEVKEKTTEFSPLFFDCRIRELTVGNLCFPNPLADANFRQIIWNMSNLEGLSLRFFKFSESQFNLLSNLLLQSKYLKMFGVKMEKEKESKEIFIRLLDHLRSQAEFSRFKIQLIEESSGCKLQGYLIN